MSKSKLIKMKLQTPVEIRAGRVEISPSDRIMVLCGGKVSGILDARTADKKLIGRLMTSQGGESHE